jgi:hypothetical protein
VDRQVRDINLKTLDIDRIYERGEILALARSVMSVLHKPSTVAPVIRGTRYDLFPTVNPIAGHSISRMAQLLAIAAGHAESAHK